jgi:hypothetical protein
MGSIASTNSRKTGKRLSKSKAGAGVVAVIVGWQLYNYMYQHRK